MNRTSELKKLSAYKLFSAVNDDVDFPLHSHNFYEIIITLENNFIHTINGRTHHPEKYEIMILRPGDEHSAQPTADKEHKIRDIYVPVSLFEEICNSLSPVMLTEIIRKNRLYPPVFRATENEIHALIDRLNIPLFTDENLHNSEFSYPRIIKKTIISEILGMYCEKQLQKEKYMPECIVQLLNALQNKQFFELPISEMAYKLGYSHNYLCAQFKAYFGKTIQQFIIDRKTEKAASLLKNTDMSVDSIAKSLGWTKTSSFIKTFSSVYRETPLQYRKKHKKAQ